jgi:hypothetical protein
MVKKLGLVFCFSLAFSPVVFAGSYPAVKTFLQELADKYPGNVKLVNIGASDSGESVMGVRIGEGSVQNLIVATHHGNEYGSTEVAKALAKSLAESPLLGQAVFVVPVLNISGYGRNQRWEPGVGGSYDANRDYPGPCVTSSSFKLKSTRGLAKFIDEQGIVASATLHTYSPAVLYPWGISTRDTSTPYDDLFRSLSQAATVESNYKIGNSTELLYPADGTFEDYAYWKHGVWSLLFELGYSHSPRPDAVAEMVKVNVPGLRRFLEQAPRERAEQHAFTGKCDVRLKSLDRQDE